jgi:hypothetical protein
MDVSYNYLTWLFQDINFKGKRVLDIGGGRGLYSYYAKYMGASEVINLDPFSDGSSGSFIDNIQLTVSHEPVYFQEFDSSIKFDVIIIHDSINHLNEAVYTELARSQLAKDLYSALIKKMYGHLDVGGIISVSDCSSTNFFNFLGLKNPFAPTIEWHLHQPPSILIELFNKEDFNFVKLRWTPFKRFGFIGRLISSMGFIPAFFMQSHYNITFKK